MCEANASVHTFNARTKQTVAPLWILHASFFFFHPRFSTWSVGQRQLNVLLRQDKENKLDTSRTSATSKHTWSRSQANPSRLPTLSHTPHSYLQDARMPMGRDVRRRREDDGLQKKKKNLPTALARRKREANSGLRDKVRDEEWKVEWRCRRRNEKLRL